MKRNPKQNGSNLYDCIPQAGPCPNQCNQCYFNRPGAFYLPISQSHFPKVEEVGDGIVRVNSGHDSNIQRDYVISSTEQYPKRFFNTSIPRFNFPDPVVFTANPREEESAFLIEFFTGAEIKRLMFVRLRVSSTNLGHVAKAAEAWGKAGVPVILTFMRYYEFNGLLHPGKTQHTKFYEERKSIINKYWCPTPTFMNATLMFVQQFNPETRMCGTPESSYCKDCNDCEYYYYITKERMQNATTTIK